MSRFRFLVAALVVCAGCGGSTEPVDTTAPASIELSIDTLRAFPNRDTSFPTLTVFNSSHHAITHAVAWSSSDTNFATVLSPTGFRTKSTLGIVNFTVTAGAASATLHVKVEREPVAGVVVSPSSAVMTGRDSVQFTAYAVGPGDDSLDRVITWGTLNAAIATVSATGLVHIHSSGTGHITATSEGATDTVGIAADARLVARVTVSPETIVAVPGAHSAPWIVRQFDADGNELLGRVPKFSSSDSTIATVDFESALAKRVGVATLTIQADTASVRVPITIATVAFSSVSAGADHACGLTAAHAAYCWGTDYLGELGTTPFRYGGDAAPARVVGGLSFTSLAVGTGWSCGLVADGTPYCWGGVGQVGDGSMVPKKISGVTLVSLSNSGDRACGLDASGTAWCWGGDLEGLVFVPPTGCGTDCFWTPVATGSGEHWKVLSAGNGVHVCGVDTSDVTECWGINHSGQLGDGTRVDNPIPVVVHGGHVFANVSAGEAFTCGVTTAGDAFCWGSDTYGTIGDGTASPSCSEGNPCVTEPVAVAGSHKFTFVRSALDHVCGLTPEGAVYCWGYSNGDATPTVPILVSGGITFTSLEVNGMNCGMATDGKAYCVSLSGNPTAVLGQ